MVLKVRDVRDGLALGEIGPLSAAVWRGAVTHDTFIRQSAALRSVVELHPGTAGFLCVVEAGATPPGDQLQRASAQMIAAHGDRLALVAAVIEGSGFQAAITRSVLTTIAMIVPGLRTNVSFFSSVKAAAEWACPRIQLPEASVVVADVEALRAYLPRALGR